MNWDPFDIVTRFGPIGYDSMLNNVEANCLWYVDHRDLWPSMDVFYAGEDLLVKIALRGMEPRGLEIELEDGLLTIFGEVNHGGGIEPRGRFFRTVVIPESTDEADVVATMENETLLIVVKGAAFQAPGKKKIPIVERPSPRLR